MGTTAEIHMTRPISGMPVDPRDILLNSPMSVFQWVAVMITTGLGSLDGYNVLAVTLAAPSLAHEWAVNPAQLGIVFSAALIGMGIGSFLVAPLGDVFGRRTMVLVTLALMSVSMLMSAGAADIDALALWRLITGVGIGGTIALINPLAVEFANTRRRDLALAMMAIGFPLGGVMGGAAAAYLLSHEGWRGVFVFGGCAGIFMIGLVLWRLPEPLPFLIAKQRPDALDRVNRLLRRCGHPPVEALPPKPVAKQGARPFEIFSAVQRPATFHVAAMIFLYVITAYFFLNWMPQMVSIAGFGPSGAAHVSIISNLCGVAGGSLLGWIVGRVGVKLPAFIVLFGMGLATIAFGFAGNDWVALVLAASLAGFCVHSGMVAMHSLIARAFPTHMRASGAGFVLGVSRIGSAIGPAAGGYLFNAGLGRGEVSLILASGAILAAGLLLFYRTGQRDTAQQPSAKIGDVVSAA